MTDPFKLNLDPFRPVGFESRKMYAARCASGFWDRFITGPAVVDVGWRGGVPDAVPIVDGAIGVDLQTPGYDGLYLPVPDGSLDAVHSSHVLEHVDDPVLTLRAWFRALKIGGHLICFVPHAYLYERRRTPPSRWSGEHKSIFTPSNLVATVQVAMKPNTYRLRHLADCDVGYRYDLPLTMHPQGALEIEMVLQKIEPPDWQVEP